MRFSFTPDLSFQLRQSSQNANIRSRLQTAGEETVSGRRVDVLAASNGRLGEALILGSAVANLDRHLKSASLSGARLSGASNAIISMREGLSGFSTSGRVSAAQGNPISLSVLHTDTEAILGNIVGNLNTRIGQRHIFGGQETASSPIQSAEGLQADIDAILAAAPDTATALAEIDQFFADPAGGFQTSNYNGSDAAGPRLHISDTRSLSPLPKADDQVFKDIIKGLTLVASARNAATDEEADALMQAGFSAVDAGSEQLLDLEARMGAGLQNLDVMTDNMQSELGFLAATEQSFLGRDVFEAAAELQALEGQLQASYTVTGRLGSLSLVNFLR